MSMRCVSIARVMLFVALCGCAVAASAQETINSASVSGRVVDAQGGVMPGALVAAPLARVGVRQLLAPDDPWPSAIAVNSAPLLATAWRVPSMSAFSWLN